MVSVDIETTGFDLGRSGGNADSKTKTGADGAESGSDQFHRCDLSGEAHCPVNTPSLRSTLITSPMGAVHVVRLSPIWYQLQYWSGGETFNGDVDHVMVRVGSLS